MMDTMSGHVHDAEFVRDCPCEDAGQRQAAAELLDAVIFGGARDRAVEAIAAALAEAARPGQELRARVEALCDAGTSDVRQWGEPGSPYSNGARRAFTRIRAAIGAPATVNSAVERCPVDVSGEVGREEGDGGRNDEHDQRNHR